MSCVLRARLPVGQRFYVRSLSTLSTIAMIALSFGSTARAASQPRSAAIIWDAPAGCPTTDAVLDRLEHASTKPGQVPAPIAAAAHVIATPGEPWRVNLVLDIHGARTERRFEAESCDALADAVVLIIALAAEESASPEPLPPAVETQRPEPSPAPALAVDPASPPPTASRPSWQSSQSFLMANGLVDWGTLPDPPAPGFELVVGRRWITGRWRLGALAGAGFFPSHQISKSPLGFEGEIGYFWLLNFSARACLVAAFSQFEVGPCLGAELDTMHASGTDSYPGELANSTQLWISPLGSAVASWNVFRTLDIVFRAEVAVPTTRRSFATEPGASGSHGAEIYRVPAIAWRGAFGIALRFW